MHCRFANMAGPRAAFDVFVKSPKSRFFVIPAPAPRGGDKLQPESSIFIELQKTWTPFFNGVTTFYETVKVVSPVSDEESLLPINPI